MTSPDRDTLVVAKVLCKRLGIHWEKCSAPYHGIDDRLSSTVARLVRQTDQVAVLWPEITMLMKVAGSDVSAI